MSIRVKATFLSVEMRLFCIARPRDWREESEARFKGDYKRKILKNENFYGVVLSLVQSN